MQLIQARKLVAIRVRAVQILVDGVQLQRGNHVLQSPVVLAPPILPKRVDGPAKLTIQGNGHVHRAALHGVQLLVLLTRASLRAGPPHGVPRQEQREDVCLREAEEN